MTVGLQWGIAAAKSSPPPVSMASNVQCCTLVELHRQSPKWMVICDSFYSLSASLRVIIIIEVISNTSVVEEGEGKEGEQGRGRRREGKQ